MLRLDALQPCLETAALLVGTALAYAAGMWLQRSRHRFWAVGYLLPLLVIGMIGAARRVPRLEFIPPISWLVAGRIEFAAFGLSVALLGGILCPRVLDRRLRGLIQLFGAAVLVSYSVYAFVMPALIAPRLEWLETGMDANGICRQGTTFTCGPAAAVTALRALGFAAEEGELARLARTTPMMGTQGDLLAHAIRQRHHTAKLDCAYRYFDSLEALKGGGRTVVLMTSGLLSDHYVAILAVNADRVVLGDPLRGRREMSHAAFRAAWRRTGLVLKRVTTPPASQYGLTGDGRGVR